MRLIIIMSCMLSMAALPAWSRAQSYVSDDLGLSWYPDYDDDELLPFYEGIQEGVLAQRYPASGLIPTSPSYDDDPGLELIETSPGYVDPVEVQGAAAKAEHYATDGYGAYDRDYDWTTDDPGFDEWADGSERVFDPDAG